MTQQPVVNPMPVTNFWGLIGDPKGQAKVLDDAFTEIQALFDIEYEAARDAMGLPPEPAHVRQAKYTTRSPAGWAAMQQARPDLHKKQLQDFENLVLQTTNKSATPAIRLGLGATDPTAPGI